MNLTISFAQVDFLTPKVFHLSGGCGTRPFCSKQKGLEHPRHPKKFRLWRFLGFPEIFKLLWLKSPFA